LDQSEQRDEFRVSVGEPVFSVPSTDVFFAPLPDLNEVCATDIPSCCRRGGTLMKAWVSVRSLFTKVYARLTASGQNVLPTSAVFSLHLLMAQVT
jgi:hypothetical protein